MNVSKKIYKILDIDLDFFLDRRNTYAPNTSTKRLEDPYYTPWKKTEVRDFLEKNCSLNSSRPIRGKYFIHHIEAFHFLRNLQEENHNDIQFSIDHIDAHADLGMGDSSHKYISVEVLAEPVNLRAYPKKLNGSEGLSSGNFLAFAIACRWISELNYITNLEWNEDVPWFPFKNYDIRSGAIQLKQFAKEQFDEIEMGISDMINGAKRTVPLLEEPVVPFTKIDFRDFASDGRYDFILLTQSPAYTPESSDLLIPTIKQYMNLEF